MNQFLNHSCLRIQALSAANLRSHQEEAKLKTNTGRFCACTSVSPQLVSRQLHHKIFSIQYSPHKLHQTPKVTVFSSYLAQTISFIFRHPLNRHEHKIYFNGEQSRQHNTSQRCISTMNMCNILFTGYRNKLKGMHMEICITVRHLHCEHQSKSLFRATQRQQALHQAAHLT